MITRFVQQRLFWLIMLFVVATPDLYYDPLDQVWTGGPVPGSTSRAERQARRDSRCNGCHTQEHCYSCDTDPPVWELP